MASKSHADIDPDPLGGRGETVRAFRAMGHDYHAQTPLQQYAPATFGPVSSLADCQITRQIDHALLALRKSKRRAIRILDVGCEDGSWLIRAVLHARMLGFVAIEGRGFDATPAMVERASTTAERIVDPCIGLSFEVAHIADALGEEDDHGADIVLCHYGLIGRLPLDDHARVVAELTRVTAGTLICLGGAQ